MISKPVTYLKEVREELGKVTWPTRKEVVKMTFTVLVVSAFIAVFIGSLDFVLTNFIARILS
jgi:preprotein translocase subunit SecE